jgi:hypothetical protein
MLSINGALFSCTAGDMSQRGKTTCRTPGPAQIDQNSKNYACLSKQHHELLSRTVMPLSFLRGL